MNKKETAHVLAIMQTNYPDTFRGKSDDVLQGMVDLWQTCFSEEPVELVMEAVKAHMITSTDRYMPQIGVIKEAIQQRHKAAEEKCALTVEWILSEIAKIVPDEQTRRMMEEIARKMER